MIDKGLTFVTYILNQAHFYCFRTKSFHFHTLKVIMYIISILLVIVLIIKISHKSYHSIKIYVWVWLRILNLQNARYHMNMDWFYFHSVCDRANALSFVYFEVWCFATIINQLWSNKQHSSTKTWFLVLTEK